MKYMAINKSPYALDFALFDEESKALLKFDTIWFNEKNDRERIIEIWEKVELLMTEYKPNVVLTQMLDLRYTLKRDLVHISQLRTILRKVCNDMFIIYAEFKTDGWEKRLTKLKKPSTKAKIKIANEYFDGSPIVKRVETANAIILGEGVVWKRLQIGRD